MTERVWGYVSEGNVTIAAYFVEWTPGHPDRADCFDLIIGKWGPEASEVDRQGISLAFRRLQTGPAFMIVDAVHRTISKSSLLKEALSREQVLGMPIAERVFAICDAIYLQDHRVSSLSV